MNIEHLTSRTPWSFFTWLRVANFQWYQGMGLYGRVWNPPLRIGWLGMVGGGWFFAQPVNPKSLLRCSYMIWMRRCTENL